MNIIDHIEIKFTEQDLKILVASYCCEQGYNVTSENVEFKLGTITRGYGPGEYDEHCLKECSVKCKLKK